ncbi:MAG: UDP-N-acetylmuramate--L-alanine ligase [candidate division Zixibacteria bacterium]|nr:UDP-N-acetylmuramate--L-alanine ligase [candidate division Zixibacteria bacterium]
MKFKRIKKLHFVGVGGTGMCGIAEVLHNLGYALTGSDLKKTEVTEFLEKLGITIHYSHQAKNIGDADVVVYSSAVKQDNPELVAAREKKLPTIPRAEMLSELMKMKFSIAVAGTHGKTTTTSLLGHVLSAAGFDPTVIVGGRVLGVGVNAYVGKGDYLVAEADEFDRSILRFYPTMAVITSIESEHMECYRDLDDLYDCFVEFASRVPFYGSVIYCLDDHGLQHIRDRFSRPSISYGFSRHADLYASDLKYSADGIEYVCHNNGNTLGNVRVPLFGKHNALNSLGVIAAAMDLEIPFGTIISAIRTFPGVGRRMELVGERRGIRVYDDFAHHPTEIKTTLEGVRKSFSNRIVVVFQPHLYSRTRMFQKEFGSAFFDSDMLIVTDVFPSREQPIEGVTGELVADSVARAGHKRVEYMADKSKIPGFLKDKLSSGDIVIVIGAGDINRISPIILEEIDK